MSGHESIQAVKEGVSIQSVSCFYVYRSSRNTREHASVSFFPSPAPFDSEGAEVVHANASEGRFMWSDAV